MGVAMNIVSLFFHVQTFPFEGPMILRSPKKMVFENAFLPGKPLLKKGFDGHLGDEEAGWD